MPGKARGPPRRPPVGRVVVLAAEPVVPDTGRVRHVAGQTRGSATDDQWDGLPSLLGRPVSGIRIGIRIARGMRVVRHLPTLLAVLTDARC